MRKPYIVVVKNGQEVCIPLSQVKDIKVKDFGVKIYGRVMEVR